MELHLVAVRKDPPADNGALCIELRVRNAGKCWTTFRGANVNYGATDLWWNWEFKRSSSSLPASFNDTRFTVGQPDHFPQIGLPSRSPITNDHARRVLGGLCRGSFARSLLAKAGSGGGSCTHIG